MATVLLKKQLYRNSIKSTYSFWTWNERAIWIMGQQTKVLQWRKTLWKSFAQTPEFMDKRQKHWKLATNESCKWIGNEEQPSNITSACSGVTQRQNGTSHSWQTENFRFLQSSEKQYKSIRLKPYGRSGKNKQNLEPFKNWKTTSCVQHYTYWTISRSSKIPSSIDCKKKTKFQKLTFVTTNFLVYLQNYTKHGTL